MQIRETCMPDNRSARETNPRSDRDITVLIAQLLVPQMREEALRGLVEARALAPEAAVQLGRELSKRKYGHRAMGAKITQAKHLIDKFAETHSNSTLSATRTADHLGVLLSRAREELGPDWFSVDQLSKMSALDFGCGRKNPLGLSILLYANGVQNVCAIEPGPVDASSARSAAVELIKAIMLAPEKFNYSGISNRELKLRCASLAFDRIDQLGNVADLDFGGIRFVRSLNDERGDQFDLVVSCSVFEHVADLKHEIGAHRRLMRSGSVGVHIVDFSDHRKTAVPFDPFAFYYDDGQPGLNQLRPSDIKQIFTWAGFEIAVQGEVRVNSTELDFSRLRERFRRYSADDLTTRQATFIVRPTSASPHST